MIHNSILKFKGDYLQEPQKFSSKKINGVRAYQLARKNAKFNLVKKKVSILDLELTDSLSKKEVDFMLNVVQGHMSEV